MGIVRRLLSIGTGLAAGVLAYKLLDKYNQDAHLEGEYRVVPPEEDAEEEEAPAEEEPAAEAEEPVKEAPAEEPVRAAAPADPEGPNPNPVMRGETESPVGEDGRIDPTKVADAADFADWEDLGCKG